MFKKLLFLLSSWRESKAKRYMNSQDIVLIIGDFNGKVGDEKVDDIVGPCGIGKLNDRGNKLIEWCQTNEFTITNTWYQNHARRQWTWKSPDGKSKNKIDYILIQKDSAMLLKQPNHYQGAPGNVLIINHNRKRPSS